MVHRVLEVPRGAVAWRDGHGASRADRLIFVAGQHDIGHPGCALPQAETAMEGVGRAVEAVGGRSEDVVELVVFHTLAGEEDEGELLGQLRARVTGEVPPVADPGLGAAE